MIKENIYCTDMKNKLFNKKLAMTREDNEDFENLIKCWICVNVYADGDVKVRDHCQIIEKYRGFAHRDCNINFTLNHKIRIVFRKPKNYDLHLMMQELGKFNFQINVVPNGLENYISFKINSKFFVRQLQVWVKMI